MFTPSSIARSMSSIRLSVEPRITKVEMAPSSFSVLGDKYNKLFIYLFIYSSEPKLGRKLEGGGVEGMPPKGTHNSHTNEKQNFM